MRSGNHVSLQCSVLVFLGLLVCSWGCLSKVRALPAFSGEFLRSLLRHPCSTPINEEKARNDARALYKAGVGKFGTDESKFNEILCSRSYPQLRLTFEEYAKVHGLSALSFVAHVHRLWFASLFPAPDLTSLTLPTSPTQPACKICRHDIIRSIKSEMMGDLRHGMLAVGTRSQDGPALVFSPCDESPPLAPSPIPACLTVSQMRH